MAGSCGLQSPAPTPTGPFVILNVGIESSGMAGTLRTCYRMAIQGLRRLSREAAGSSDRASSHPREGLPVGRRKGRVHPRQRLRPTNDDSPATPAISSRRVHRQLDCFMNPPGAFAAKYVDASGVRPAIERKPRLDDLPRLRRSLPRATLRIGASEFAGPADPPVSVGFDYRLLAVGRHSIFLRTTNSCPCAFSSCKDTSRAGIRTCHLRTCCARSGPK